mmetsp:Transcript_125609/g.287769  ORF Transcript_125609/g.287769 Transcript_125609/m.287769 type:complete len:394 (+) Transcript_125609:819-2000(+)
MLAETIATEELIRVLDPVILVPSAEALGLLSGDNCPIRSTKLRQVTVHSVLEATLVGGSRHVLLDVGGLPCRSRGALAIAHNGVVLVTVVHHTTAAWSRHSAAGLSRGQIHPPCQALPGHDSVRLPGPKGSVHSVELLGGGAHTADHGTARQHVFKLRPSQACHVELSATLLLGCAREAREAPHSDVVAKGNWGCAELSVGHRRKRVTHGRLAGLNPCEMPGAFALHTEHGVPSGSPIDSVSLGTRVLHLLPVLQRCFCLSRGGMGDRRGGAAANRLTAQMPIAEIVVYRSGRYHRYNSDLGRVGVLIGGRFLECIGSTKCAGGHVATSTSHSLAIRVCQARHLGLLERAHCGVVTTAADGSGVGARIHSHAALPFNLGCVSILFGRRTLQGL